MLQMQVTVPAGVNPGDPFQVNTPNGPMQVVCPPGASGGGQMMVNVPAPQSSAPQPMVMAPAQPMEAVATVVGEAVEPSTMLRGDGPGFMMEAKSGCYYQQNAPCCNMHYYMFDSTRSQYMAAGCFCCVFCGPIPGCCGVWARQQGQEYKDPNSNYRDKWESPTKFRRFGTFYPSQGEVYTKC